MPRGKKSTPVIDEPAAAPPITVGAKRLAEIAALHSANDLHRPDGPLRCILDAHDTELIATHYIAITEVHRQGYPLLPVRVSGYTLIPAAESPVEARPFVSGEGYQGLIATWDGERYILTDPVTFELDETTDEQPVEAEGETLPPAFADPAKPDPAKLAQALAVAAGAPELPLIRRRQMPVKTDLDAETVADLAHQAAELSVEKVRFEVRKKAEMAELTEEIKTRQLRIDSLLQTINDNATEDMIEVDERADYEHGTCRIYRSGTNELIETRALTQEEQQTRLQFPEGEESTPTDQETADDPRFTVAKHEDGSYMVVDSLGTEIESGWWDNEADAQVKANELNAAADVTASDPAIHEPCVFCDDQEGGCAQCNPAVEPHDESAVDEAEQLHQPSDRDIDAAINGLATVGYPVKG